ncbi:MAG: YbbR-like domain-containing protein [Christensenellales bacterium]
MTNKPDEKLAALPSLRQIFKRLRSIIAHNWGIKLVCLLLAIVLWGGLISQDANLTREKTFMDVPINAAGGDTLIRNGLIVVSGLDDLPPIQVRAAVPQRNYGAAQPAAYNVRVDLSRITSAGEQTLPVISSSSTIYGQVTWLSVTEVKVQVDEYITRRRIPVQLGPQTAAPAGFYAPPPSVDPSTVVVSGPASAVTAIARVLAQFDVSRLPPQAGSLISAVSFTLQTTGGEAVDPRLVTVTSNEAILLDTVLVDQVLFPLKSVDISLDQITLGEPARGYHVADITASPAYLSVAGTNELLKSLTQLQAASQIDLTGAKETLVRAIKIEKPQGVQYMSEEAVYVTVVIAPDIPAATPSPPPAVGRK